MLRSRKVHRVLAVVASTLFLAGSAGAESTFVLYPALPRLLRFSELVVVGRLEEIHRRAVRIRYEREGRRIVRYLDTGELRVGKLLKNYCGPLDEFVGSTVTIAFPSKPNRSDRRFTSRRWVPSYEVGEEGIWILDDEYPYCPYYVLRPDGNGQAKQPLAHEDSVLAILEELARE